MARFSNPASSDQCRWGPDLEPKPLTATQSCRLADSARLYFRTSVFPEHIAADNRAPAGGGNEVMGDICPHRQDGHVFNQSVSLPLYQVVGAGGPG